MTDETPVAGHPHPGPLREGKGCHGWNAAAIYAIFFLSGAAALTYEISWSRQIGLLFGNTASAAATVLASYFVGLAFGYALSGRLARHSNRPLLFYGLMELAAAGWALIVPILITLLEEGHLASLLHAMSPALRNLARAALCLLLFLPATTALGATLPLMVRWLGDAPSDSGARIAWAYGLNTFGGLTGVLLATIVLLSQVGVVASSYLAAAGSACCGIVAMALSRFAGSSDGRRDQPSASPPTSKRRSREYGLPQLAALVALSGFVTLALEVLYTRLFALTFHNSTYTFGLIVAVVLFGLAAGAWAAAWLHRFEEAGPLAGWAFLLAGGAISLSTLIFLNQTGLSYFRGGTTFAGYMTSSVGLVAVIVFVPALLLGMVLPLLWDAAAASNVSVAQVVGRLTSVNTLSAAGGALAASFFLLPALGLWSSFAAVAVVCILASAWLLAAERSIAYWVTATAMGCLTVAAWYVTSSQTAVPKSKTLVSRAEGTYGWIDVLKDTRSGALSLRENINYTHGSTASANWERRQSHIPLLLHSAPRDVLYLGSGTGGTAGGAVMHDEIESIVIAELIPEVVDAARQFKKSNLGVLDDPRTEVHIDDAPALPAGDRSQLRRDRRGPVRALGEQDRLSVHRGPLRNRPQSAERRRAVLSLAAVVAIG